MTIARIVLWLDALGFGGFGLLFVLRPHWAAATVDLQLPTATATTDFIATYGGFEIGFAVFLFWCLRRAARVRTGLVAAGCAIAGFAASRGVAILVLGGVKPVLYQALVVEALFAALTFRAARGAARE